jgi:NAD(P)H-flavin reductase
MHDILAHFVILSELTSDTHIEGTLKIGNLVFVQIGDDGLFLQGHVSQDITDNLVYVGWVGHIFSAGPKIFNSAATAYFLGHHWPGSQASTNKLIASAITTRSTGLH